jgi:polyhydroxyalkanoate synthesis regulator phasin
MSRRTKLALAAAGTAVLAIAVGASGAIAVSRALDGDASRAVIEDAADLLGVEPDALSDALKQALQNSVDEAVEDGRLTEEQGERLKERIESGQGPFMGGFGFRGGDGFGFGPGLGHHLGFASLEAAASFLDVTEDALRDRLRDGDTLAEVARDRGKSVAGLVDALVDAANERIDEAVEAGRLDVERAAELREDLESRITELVNGELRFRGHGRMFGRGFGFHGGPPPFAGPRA